MYNIMQSKIYIFPETKEKIELFKNICVFEKYFQDYFEIIVAGMNC